jgi:hypothetical protein
VLRATSAAEALIKKLSVFSRRAWSSGAWFGWPTYWPTTEGLLRPLLDARRPLVLEIDATRSSLRGDRSRRAEPCRHQPGHQRPRRHAAGGEIRLRLARIDAISPCRDLGWRHRIGDRRVGAGAHLRALLHHQEQGKGSGLGLAMVYGFAHQSDGSISVESELGRGSTFRLRLPTVAGSPVTAPNVHGEDVRGRGETVLVVEDEPSFCSDAGHAGGPGLPRAGRANGWRRWKPRRTQGCAGSGDQRRDHALARRIRARGDPPQSRPDLPVLFMSGYPTGGELKSVSVPDDALFLAKPFKPEALARCIRHALTVGAAVRESSLDAA